MPPVPGPKIKGFDQQLLKVTHTHTYYSVVHVFTKILTNYESTIG